MSRTKQNYRLWNRNGVYYYKLNNQDKWTSSGETSKTKCENYIHRLMKDEEFKREEEKKSSPTFKSYTKDFFLYNKCPRTLRLRREGKEVTERYCKEMRSVLVNKIHPSTFSSLKMKEIRRKHIIDLIDELVKNGNSNGRVNDCISVLSVIFNESVYREDIDRNPMTGIKKLKEVRKEKIPFTFEDYIKMFPIDNETELLKLWDTYSKFLVSFIECNTGMRNGEVRCLKWKNVDFENNLIRITESFKTLGTDVVGLPKNGKTRTTGMCDELKKVLLIQKTKYSTHTEPDDFVCSWEDGKPIRYEPTRDQHNSVLEEVNVKHRGQHIFRHTFNTDLRSSEYVSDLDIRTTTGWSSEQIQNNYTHTDISSSNHITDGQNKIWEEIKKYKEEHEQERKVVNF